MDERTVLRRAKEVLLERGWQQGSYCADYTGESGAVCLMGAVALAEGLGSPFAARGDSQVLISLVKHCGEGPMTWNDDPRRTFEEVIDLLDSALASLEVETPELVA